MVTASGIFNGSKKGTKYLTLIAIAFMVIGIGLMSGGNQVGGWIVFGSIYYYIILLIPLSITMAISATIIMKE